MTQTERLLLKNQLLILRALGHLMLVNNAPDLGLGERLVDQEKRTREALSGTEK